MSSNIKKFRIISYKAKAKPVLEIKNVSKSFDGLPVLKNLNLKILPGSINGLLGENGSGKTTLFNLILGTLRVDKGEIFAKNHTIISTMAIHDRCKRFKIAYVPQRISLMLGMTAADNLIGIAELLLKDRRKINEICDRLLTEFSLLDVANIRANDLSGGQKKKLSIARALIGDPDIILFDEIFAALSPKIIETIKKLIANLQTSRRSLTILLSDHIWQHVTELSDIVHILSGGEIIRSLKPADVVKDERARAEYFGNI